MMQTSDISMVNDIFAVTSKLQDDFPAIYEHLLETPVYENENSSHVNTSEYLQYLETIRIKLILCENKPIPIKSTEPVC
jgi:hypothetical protein